MNSSGRLEVAINLALGIEFGVVASRLNHVFVIEIVQFILSEGKKSDGD